MHIIFIILSLGVIIGFTRHFKLISYLKKKHCAVWEKLGKPSLLNSSIKNNVALNKFLSAKEYLSLNDLTLNELARNTFIFGRVHVGIFISIVILVIVYIIKSR